MLNVRAGTPALPGCTWFGHFAFSACGRGRPRSQVARGSVISPSPHAGGNARAPSIRFNLCENCYRPARRLMRSRRQPLRTEPGRLRQWRAHADHCVTRTPTMTLSPHPSRLAPLASCLIPSCLVPHPLAPRPHCRYGRSDAAPLHRPSRLAPLASPLSPLPSPLIPSPLIPSPLSLLPSRLPPLSYLRYSAFASASMAASADLPASSLMAVRPVAIR